MFGLEYNPQLIMTAAARFALLVGVCVASTAAAAPTAAPAPAPAPAAARRPEMGHAFIRTYQPAEVGGDNQNWAIVQDRRGVIYVGSSNGVTEFDGSEWRFIPTPAFDTVRSLAIDDAGRIYAGTVGDFGYLAPDPRGDLQFVSLLSRVPKDAARFSDVWRTFVTPDGVLFESAEYVFRWAHDAIEVIRPPSRLNRGSAVNGRFYVTLPESGLNVLDGSTLRALPGTMSLANELYPVILRYDDRRLLIGTRRNGLFLYDGATLVPFLTELDTLIKTKSLYRGAELADGTLALATTAGGFGIIDREGHRIAVFE